MISHEKQDLKVSNRSSPPEKTIRGKKNDNVILGNLKRYGVFIQPHLLILIVSYCVSVFLINLVLMLISLFVFNYYVLIFFADSDRDLQ